METITLATARTQPLDRMFMALADPFRRGMVEHLSSGPATVKQLATPFGMRLPSAVKHLKLLEDCGIVSSRKNGRNRTYSIEAPALRSIGDWARKREDEWNKAFDRLAAAMEDIAEEESR